MYTVERLVSRVKRRSASKPIVAGLAAPFCQPASESSYGTQLVLRRSALPDPSTLKVPICLSHNREKVVAEPGEALFDCDDVGLWCAFPLGDNEHAAKVLKGFQERQSYERQLKESTEWFGWSLSVCGRNKKLHTVALDRQPAGALAIAKKAVLTVARRFVLEEVSLVLLPGFHAARAKLVGTDVCPESERTAIEEEELEWAKLEQGQAKMTIDQWAGGKGKELGDTISRTRAELRLSFV